jgi:hypothetical protein
MSKELKRMQKLAGLNEIRVNPPGTYNAIFQDWVEGQINMLLQYPEDYQRELEYIKPFKKVSVSSLEELAQTIKEIDDHITEQSDERDFGQKDELISLLDKLYNEDEF